LSQYSHENQFLLDCLRSIFQQNSELEVDSSLKWDPLLESAYRHRVVPQLFRALRSHQMPAALKEQHDSNALHNLRLAGELKRILSFLPVSAIPFKGPVLALQVYGNVSYRQFDDLDLLIRKEDLSLAKEALLENDYMMIDRLRAPGKAAILKSQHHIQFLNTKLGILLEVHWQIAPKIYSFGLSVPDLFERAETINAFGQKIPTLSREDVLLVLSEHGARHYWSRLSWVCDIARICQLRLDWQETLERARSLGILRATILAVSLTRDLLGTDVSEIHSQSADESVSRLALEVKNRLFDQFSPTDTHTERFYIRCRERDLDKLRYYIYRATLPTEEDLACIGLPNYLFAFYGLIRPIRLLNKYGSKVVEWLR
jgi:hypothetical protein